VAFSSCICEFVEKKPVPELCSDDKWSLCPDSRPGVQLRHRERHDQDETRRTHTPGFKGEGGDCGGDQGASERWLSLEHSTSTPIDHSVEGTAGGWGLAEFLVPAAQRSHASGWFE